MAAPRCLSSSAPAALAAPIHAATRYARRTRGQASHVYADHRQVVGIVAHRQLGEEDIAEIRNMNHMTERLHRRRNLDRLPVRTFRADVLDLDMFDQ